MKQNKQLSLLMLETEIKLSKSNDPVKQIFDTINFDFIYDLVKDKYSDE